MYKRLLQRVLSVFTVLALVAQMVPVQILAAEAGKTPLPVLSETAEATPDSESAQIVEEIAGKRTEYTKQFRLSNGLSMAVLYPEAVHYQENGQWKEIDNTLTLSDAAYVNTAGGWQVSLPQRLSKDKSVSVSKDGYTLRFQMAGELRAEGGLSTAAIGSEKQTFQVQEAQSAQGQVQQLDQSKAKAAAEHPETVPDTLRSRLRYDDVFAGTDIIYDLSSNQLKESIVMEAYSQSLRGYRYILETGSMTPVLTDSGSIELYGTDKTAPVMVMPAPYLVDDGGEYSYDVGVDLTGKGGSYVLTYTLPTQWLAAEERRWPVILDPVVTTVVSPLNIKDVTLYQRNAAPNYMGGVLQCGYNDTYGIARAFLQYADLPDLTSSDVIVSANLRMYRAFTTSWSNIIEIHKINHTWDNTTVTWATQPEIDPTVVDFTQAPTTGQFFHWDITDIVQGWYGEENTGLAITAPQSVETGTAQVVTQFWSSDYSGYQVEEKPCVTIVFRNNNGLESYWDYTTASAGRAGTGYVNNYAGNLVWVRGDMGFGGNRMPVSISHIYNTNDSGQDLFGLGYGWRTNYNQRVYIWSKDNSYYVWEDGDGTKHYFYASGGSYVDEDGLELTLTKNGTGTKTYCITDKYGNMSYFDASGRLSKQVNNQQTPSEVTITYGTGNRIASITDGAGRVYRFTYTNDLLTDIKYYGTGTDALFQTSYGYTGSQLTFITDKDGGTCNYTYNTSNLLTSARDIDGYKLCYEYNIIAAGKPSRVSRVREYDDTTLGGELTLEYAHNQTVLTDANGNQQILQFNNWGNTVSVQDGQGRAQYAGYTTDSDSDGKANQLTLSSRLQNTVGNLLWDGSFESNTLWTATSGAVTASVSEEQAFYGSKSLKLTRSVSGTAEGVYSTAFSAEAGQTYTFSAYVKTGTGTASLALHDGTAATVSQTLGANSEWTRLQVSYTNTSGQTKTLTARLLTETVGVVYMDCAQVEKAPTASRYNLIENGDFRYGLNGWTNTGGGQLAQVSSAAPQLSGDVLSITGGHTQTKHVSQQVALSGKAGDTLILSGWAKGDSTPYFGAYEETRQFSLMLTFHYADGGQKTETVRFQPDTDSTVSWQYASLPLVAEKDYTKVEVLIAYDYNANTALFDGIQLYKEAFGSSYTYNENGDVTSVKDVQGQTTQYEYTGNDLTKQILPTGAELTYTYDEYHNVKTATTAEGLSYSFEYDAYGNNTRVEITGNGLTMASQAEYTNNGNTLSSVTDALGKTTLYGYNANTGVLDWVQYPEDSETLRTSYTYDAMYRAEVVTSQLSADTALTVTYGYTDDLLTSVNTGSTEYTFDYGIFDLRTAVKIGSRELASYSYTDDQYFNLEKLEYGNSDSVSYTYDSLGRVTLETYEDGDTVSYSYDNNGALATVTDSATGRTTTYYYDSTDRLMKVVESGAGYSHAVGYAYDNINNLTGLTEVIDGQERTVNYTYDEDNRIVGMTVESGARTYTYDSLGRLSQRVSGLSDGSVLTETFTYTAPSAAATSGQVATMRLQGAGLDVTYSYTYDDNGNILTVSDGTHTTSYTYDRANQLLREDNQAGGFTHVWSYDTAGNILSRTEYGYTTGELGTPTDTVGYTYGDTDWGDLLTAYDGVNISYDEIGNPLSDGTWSYTWEHGRELASMTDGTATWNFTYDVNGLRTVRTNGSTAYNYIYNGGSLSKLTVGNNTLYFTYGAEGHPLTLTHNGTTYFYATNLQGDVVAILDSTGNPVVRYTYDAWGSPLTVTDTSNISLATLNPLRYRGYVFDHETGLYYLQSRYYDPSLGRFLNADAFVSTGQGQLGNNMFAYCGNNPVIRTDDSGKGWWIAASAIVGGIVAAATKIVANVSTGKEWNEGVIGAAVGGATYGAVLASTCNVAAAGYSSAAAESVTNEVISYTPVAKYNGAEQKELTTENGLMSLGTVFVDTLINGTANTITGKVAGIIIPTNNGWFKPIRIASSFAGRYAIKSELQTVIQGVMTYGIELVKSGLDWTVSRVAK